MTRRSEGGVFRVPGVGALPALAVAILASACGPADSLPVVEPNDNRVAAGEMGEDTLSLALVVEMASWYPEGDGGPYAELAAIAVEGEAPSIPAPLIRVRTGTVLDVTVRNALADSTVTLHGLATRPAPVDSVPIAPGQSHRFTFEAGDPGTYMYFARPGFVDHENYEVEQLLGAFVVDPPSGPTDDRILVMNIWSEANLDDEGVVRLGFRNALAVNGRAFPFGERLTATVGEEERWRVVNGTARQHPMHLHGFYYDVESVGDPWGSRPLPPDERRHVVTEDMDPFQTMDIRWTPERDGNWLFHCHLVFHVAPVAARLRPVGFEGPVEGAYVGDSQAHMSGLAVAIEVSYGPGGAPPAPEVVRQVQLFVQEGTARGGAPRSMGYVLQRDEMEPAADSIEIPGTPILLTRGEPTEVLVVNRLDDATGVHWHGLELESYSDGVAGFSGNGDRLAPLVGPGETFAARLLLEKAGTFIYHTHFDDVEQLTSGLYGALIVLEPGETFDPTTDHIVTAAWDGEAPERGVFSLVVDGEFGEPEPLEVEAGVEQRFRFINIAPAARFFFSLEGGSGLVPLRHLAKDGADLPMTMRRETDRAVRLNVGETADVTVTLAPGEYELVVENPGPAPRGFVRRVIAR